MKTPWDFRNEKNAALLNVAQPPFSNEASKSDDESYAKSAQTSPAKKPNTRKMAIYDFDFNSAKPAVSSENAPSANKTQGALSANLSQVYFAQFNKGSISTKPFEVTVQNGNKREKVTAMFVYDYSVENSDKNIGKVALMIISEIKVKPFLQDKKVSVVLDNNSQVNLGVSKYFKTRRTESIVFENIDRNEILSITASRSLNLIIGKTKTDINDFKQIIDEFINTLR